MNVPLLEVGVRKEDIGGQRDLEANQGKRYDLEVPMTHTSFTRSVIYLHGGGYLSGGYGTQR